MLANGRPKMVERAIRSFKSQTYAHKRLLIWDNGNDYEGQYEDDEGQVSHVAAPRKAVGEMRNEANGFWSEFPLIAHWDSDDWSHPARLAEQVSLLMDTSKDCVGYGEVLFWDTRTSISEAWIYRHPDPNWSCGSSLMYRYSLWQEKPFPALARGSDQRWYLDNSIRCASRSGIPRDRDCRARMVCEIHRENTNSYSPKAMVDPINNWWQAPEWDKYCAEVMK